MTKTPGYLDGQLLVAMPAMGDERFSRSVIYLWMGGGVTHIDSFDPKPAAPEEIRGISGKFEITA